MLHITDFIEEPRLKKILRQYAGVFQAAVYLLDIDRNIILKFPEDEAPKDLALKPLHLNDLVIAYAAMAEGPSGALNFFADNISEVLRMGYEIQSLSSEVARTYEELSLSWKTSKRLGSGLNIDTICNVLADEVMGLCPSRNVMVLLVNDTDDCVISPAMTGTGDGPPKQGEGGFFFPKVSLGADTNRAAMMVFSTKRGLLGHVFNNKEPITVCDVRADGRFEGFPYPVTRILIVPLIVEDSVIGAVVANDKLCGKEYFTTEIKLISSLASECAISIKKAILFEEISGMLFTITESFASAIDAKDPYTYGHSRRVAEMAASISREMGAAPERVNWIRLAALLHDIGKIGTPENILHKDGKLSSDEKDRIMQHAMTGAKMIEHIHRMKDIARWVNHHHERYDGSGYPSGLKGDEIPEPSRIIAIADYFDALTSDRPYRTALSKEEALEVMKEAAGPHLDPKIFRIFENMPD